MIRLSLTFKLRRLRSNHTAPRIRLFGFEGRSFGDKMKKLLALAFSLSGCNALFGEGFEMPCMNLIQSPSVVCTCTALCFVDGPLDSGVIFVGDSSCASEPSCRVLP